MEIKEKRLAGKRISDCLLNREELVQRAIKVWKGVHPNGRRWQLMVVDSKCLGERKVHQQFIRMFGVEVVEYGPDYKIKK